MSPSGKDLLDVHHPITPPEHVHSRRNQKANTSLIPSQLITANNSTNLRNYNLRHNVLFGDCAEKKNPDSIRIWLQNPNGINIQHNMEDFTAKLHFMKKMQIDLWAIPEHNIDWTRHNNERLRQAAAAEFGHCKVIGTSSDESCLNSYKPGGAMIIARGNIIGRINTTGEDSTGLGRWCYICFNRYGDKKWWVICGYRVCQDRTTGLNTAFNQQERILRKRGETQPNPKKKWDHDMLRFLHSIGEDDQVLLLTDANAGLEDVRFGDFVSKSRLFDLIGSKKGGDTPPTFIAGKRTLDHALGTNGLLDTITRCGYVPFHQHLFSDHRGGYLDFSTSTLFRGIPPELYTRPARQFTLKHKKRVHEFLSTASSQLIQQDIARRVAKVEKEIPLVDAESSYQAIENIHNDFHNVLQQAAENLSPMHTTWWTVEIHIANQLVTYWATVISFRRNNMIGDEILGYLRQQIDDSVDIYQGDPTRGDHGQLRKACKARRDARRDSYEKRQKELEQRMLESCDEDDRTIQEDKKQTILKAIKNAEARKRMYKLFKRYLKPSNQSTLGHVDVPDYHKLRLLYLTSLIKWTQCITEYHYVVPWVTLWTVPFSNIATFLKTAMPHKRIVEKNEMNDQLYKFHVEHFSQAQGSPFTVSPLREYFGESLEESTAIAFLQGDTEIENHPTLKQATKRVLQAVKPSANDPPEIDTHITAEDVKGGFKVWKEATSTSPLGNHLGMYKAWLLNKRPSGILSADEFCSILAGFLNIAARLQRPYSRWQTVHNIYLQKEAGNYRIHRLRMIHIIDAELNLYRREIVTRRLMRNAEKHDYLTDTQYGGRGGRAAIDIPILRTFMYETFHLTRANIAITDCDAKACYDRIVAIVTALVEIKAGLPLGIATLLIKALKQMEYHMLTAYGVSKQTNSHSIEEPVHGIGQGPTDAPAGNTFNSDITAKQYEENVHGCNLLDPTEQLIAVIKLLTFVDDSTLTHGGPTFDTSPEDLMAQINDEIHTWDDYLQVIGQLLEILKTSYSMLIWRFETDGEPRILDNTELPDNTVTLQRQGIVTTVQRYDAKEAPRMLGVHKALNLDESTEKKVLRQKTQKFRKALIACPSKYHEVWISYSTIYIPSVTYAFPAISLEEKDCETIHSQLMPILLPRLGYHHGFPRAVAFASEESYGMGLYNLKALHFSHQVENLVKHIRAENSVGTTAQIMLRWGQLCSGMGKPILETHQKIPHLEGKWIKNLRFGLKRINGKLVLTQPWIRRPQRENDVHLMDAVLSSNLCSRRELRQINYCRYVMQIEHVSDITTSDGTRIHPQFLRSTAPLANKTTDLLWPQQQSPSARVWKVWRKMVCTILCSNGRNLRQPLGKWFQLYKPWHAYYDSGMQAIFTINNNTWYVHPVKYSNRRILEISTKGTPCSKPARLHKLSPVTDLTPINDRPFSQCSIPSAVRRKRRREPPSTFSEFIQTLPAWERVLLRSLEEMQSSALSLKTMLALAQDLWFVTDGGAVNGLGYFGWVIATDCHILWRGYGHAQGHPDFMESLRAEGSSLLALLIYLQRYTEFHNLLVPADIATHHCDNKTLVGRINEIYTQRKLSPSQWLQADRDIHAQIVNTLNIMGLSLPSHHVKGHQDSKKGPQRLTWQAKLNIICDDLATKARRCLEGTELKNKFLPLPAAKINLLINDKCIPKSHRSAITTAWTSQDLRKHLMRRFGWNSSVCDEIEWYPGGRILRSRTYAQKRFIVRYTHERLPCHGEPFTDSSELTCPYCNAVEYSQHFLTCEHNPEKWEDLVADLTDKWKEMEVDPVLRILLIMALTDKKLSTTLDDHPDISWEPYRALIHSQSRIGWEQIKYGRMSVEWVYQQQVYKAWAGQTQDDAHLWIRRTISKIWNFAQYRWHARCNMKHGNNESYQAAKEDLLHRIKHLYSHQERLLAQDRNIYTHTIDQWKDKPVTAMKLWLKISRPYIHHCLKLAKQQAAKKTRDIRQYLSNPPSVRLPGKRTKKHRTKVKSSGAFSGKEDISKQTIDIRKFMPEYVPRKRKEPKSQTRDNKEPRRRTTSGITKYFKSQDRPPDGKGLKQRVLHDFFISRS